MAYTKTTWVDCQTPAINATNLNKIETGIGDLHTTLANVSLNSGEIRIGGASDYLAVEADGTIEFNGEATVWDDLRIIPGNSTDRGHRTRRLSIHPGRFGYGHGAL